MHAVKWFQVAIYCLHTIKRAQALLFNHLILYQSFAFTQLNVFKYCKWLNNSIQPIDRSLTDTTTPGSSGPGSNDNEGKIHICKSSMAEIPPLDVI